MLVILRGPFRNSWSIGKKKYKVGNFMKLPSLPRHLGAAVGWLAAGWWHCIGTALPSEGLRHLLTCQRFSISFMEYLWGLHGRSDQTESRFYHALFTGKAPVRPQTFKDSFWNPPCIEVFDSPQRFLACMFVWVSSSFHCFVPCSFFTTCLWP